MGDLRSMRFLQRSVEEKCLEPALTRSLPALNRRCRFLPKPSTILSPFDGRPVNGIKQNGIKQNVLALVGTIQASPGEVMVQMTDKRHCLIRVSP